MEPFLKFLAALLETSPNYRVLRRLLPQNRFSSEGPTDAFIGIILDTETTGMTPGVDEVIELGMLMFHYARTGESIGAGQLQPAATA
jgi:DNA polymerase III subunit epsilon